MIIRGIVFAAAVGCAFSAPAFAKGGHGSAGHSTSHVNSSEHVVKGYTTRTGTYVAPHYQTDPNGTRNDNFSTRGNVNPHTGEEGTKPRDGETTPH